MSFQKLKALFKIENYENGNSIEEIERIEKKLGVKLPSEVFEIYHLLGKDSRFIKSNHPRSLDELFINEFGYLEMYIDDLTGDRIAIDIQKNRCCIYHRSMDKWEKIESSILDIIFHLSFYNSYQFLDFVTSKVSVNNFQEIKNKLDRDFKNISSNIINYDEFFCYQSNLNDLIILESPIFLVFGANNQKDYARLTQYFAKQLKYFDYPPHQP